MLATTSMVPPPSPPAPKANVQAVENGYLQALRRELEQRKRYPSGRQASLYALLGKLADLFARGLERYWLRWHPGYQQAGA